MGNTMSNTMSWIKKYMYPPTDELVIPAEYSKIHLNTWFGSNLIDSIYLSASDKSEDTRPLIPRRASIP